MLTKITREDAFALGRRLSSELEGEVLFDDFSRGRYSTDASMYQILPVGVVVPRHDEDARCAIRIAIEHGVPVLPRGAGTSQFSSSSSGSCASRSSLSSSSWTALGVGLSLGSLDSGLHFVVISALVSFVVYRSDPARHVRQPPAAQ